MMYSKFDISTSPGDDEAREPPEDILIMACTL